MRKQTTIVVSTGKSRNGIIYINILWYRLFWLDNMDCAEIKQRHIFCLEGNWNKHPHSKQSIKPILELLFTSSKIKYVYHKCPTKEDFIQGLQTFTQKRYSNYTILYIAYHGRRNRIYFGKEYITLKEIANITWIRYNSE